MRATNFAIAQIYSVDQIKDLNQSFENKQINIGQDKAAKLSVKTSKVKTAKFKDIKEHLDDFIKFTKYANQKFFNFDLFPLNDEIIVKHNSYEIGSEYSWHIDADTVSKERDFKLTGLINCSEDEYEGGDLYVFNRGIEFECREFKKPGSVIIFPSFHNHKVTKLLSGHRMTMGLYFPGPKFK